MVAMTVTPDAMIVLLGVSDFTLESSAPPMGRKR
jgi:hypothetical protein